MTWRWARTASGLVAAGGLLFATSGCSPAIQTGGHELTDPAQPLQAALSKLKKDNYDSIQNNSVTISDTTNCFYQKPNQDADDITDQVACGPIRRIGQPDDRVWDTYRLKFTDAADGKSTATVEDLAARGVTVNTDLLMSPDGSKPGTVADVPAPQVPQTSVTNRAVALPDDDIDGVSFTDLEKPTELITPTARVQITATAEPKQVPEQLVAGQDDPAGDAPYYRPATGQKLYAYRVKIIDPAEQDVPQSTDPGVTVPDLTTQLRITAGDQRLPIVDHTTSSDATSAVKINCGASTGSYPCRPKPTDFVILMTAPDDATVSLEATTAKKTQSVDPQSGRLTSSVSQVEYSRKKLTAKVDDKLKVPSYQAKITVSATEPDPSATAKPEGDKSAENKTAGDRGTGDKSTGQSAPPAPQTKIEKASWSMNVDSVALTAYDATRGWAPAGKAWLLVQTSKYAKHDPDNAFTDRRASSIALTADGTTYRPDGLADADFAAGADLADSAEVTWAFQVPDNLTEASLDLTPTGTVTAGGSTATFTVPDPASAQLKLPN